MKRWVFFALFLCVVLSACSAHHQPIGSTTKVDQKIKQGRVAKVHKQSSPFSVYRRLINTAYSSVTVDYNFVFPLNAALDAPSGETASKLDAIATILKKYPNTRAMVEGHTWRIGDDQANRSRTISQVLSLKQRLVDKYGSDAARIMAIGYGESNPTASNATPHGRQLNRRLHVMITGVPAAKLEWKHSQWAQMEFTMTPGPPQAPESLEASAKIQILTDILKETPKAQAHIQVRHFNGVISAKHLQQIQQKVEAVKTRLLAGNRVSPERVVVLPPENRRKIAHSDAMHGSGVVAVKVDAMSFSGKGREAIAQKASLPESMIQLAGLREDIKKHGPPHPDGRAVVLCYHGVDMPRNSLSISSQMLEKQVRYFLDNGYTFLSMDSFARFMKSGQGFPDKSVLVSFDDGWKSVKNGAEVMKRHNLPFTLFLSMKYVGQDGTSCLSAADIDELKQYPHVTLANHSYEHGARVSRKSGTNSPYYLRAVQQDIEKSKEKFHRLVGYDTPYFAFPFGVRNDVYVSELRKAGFELMFSTSPTLVDRRTDPLNIPRIGGHNLRLPYLQAMFDRRPATPTTMLATAAPAKAIQLASVESKTQTPQQAQSRMASKPLTQPTAKTKRAAKAPKATAKAELTPSTPTYVPLTPAAPQIPAPDRPAKPEASLQTPPSQRVAQNTRIQGKYTPRTRSQAVARQSVVTPKYKNENVIQITAVGDVLLGSTYPMKQLPPKDGATLFTSVKPYFTGDIVFGNLEGPMIDAGKASKCRKGSTRCHEFRMPTRYAKHLVDAGFNAMSVANNHSHDFGFKGSTSTLKTLRKNKIAPIGGSAVAYFTFKGKRIAMLGFGHNRKQTSHAITDVPKAKLLVKKLKKHNDMVIVSFHGGAEGSSAVNVPGRVESFCGENRGDVKKFAHSVIDAGADLVLGHGPHVLRAMEVYKGKFIAYSLGNFVGYEMLSTAGVCGLSAVLNVSLDINTGRFVSGQVTSVRLTRKGIPQIDDSNSAITQIRKLTVKNLGKNKLLLSDAGWLAPPDNTVASAE